MKRKEKCEACRVPISRDDAIIYKNLCKDCYTEPVQPLLGGNHLGGYARHTQMLENGDTDDD